MSRLESRLYNFQHFKYVLQLLPRGDYYLVLADPKTILNYGMSYSKIFNSCEVGTCSPNNFTFAHTTQKSYHRFISLPICYPFSFQSIFSIKTFPNL